MSQESFKGFSSNFEQVFTVTQGLDFDGHRSKVKVTAMSRLSRPYLRI